MCVHIRGQGEAVEGSALKGPVEFRRREGGREKGKGKKGRANFKRPREIKVDINNNKREDREEEGETG